MELNSLFPARCAWPEAIDDVGKAANDATAIRLATKAKGFRNLPLLPGLKALWCFDVNADAVEAIGECVSLESLYIDNLRIDNVRTLLKLKNLRILSIESCSRISSIPDFQSLPLLRGLGLTHFSNVHDLAPLSSMGHLTALAVSGSMWKTMTVSSFSPLRGLTGLVSLHLTNIKAADESLEPLRALANLKQLDLANFYPTREFARLALSLASTECLWFKPVIEVNFGKCSQCGGNKVMLSGKGASTTCPQCRKKKIDAHLLEWNAA